MSGERKSSTRAVVYTLFELPLGSWPLTAYKGPCDGQRHVLHVQSSQADQANQGTACQIGLSNEDGEIHELEGVRAMYRVAWRAATRGYQGPCLVYAGAVLQVAP